MTSEERHKARYQRRVEKRQAKKAYRNRETTFENVFSFKNLYNAYKQSRKGVLWKSSVQTYKANALANVYKTYKLLMAHRYKTRGFVEFDIVERGKPRHIRSVHVSERVIQRCLCDECLVPQLRAAFIYDNGASLKGKGIDFSLARLERHLQAYYKKHGNSGYVLTFDFSKYFDTAAHAPILEQYDKCLIDRDLKAQAKYFLDQFGDTGIGLGSQISQISALALPNTLDHFIKESRQIRWYGRYMDDGYLIHHDKAYLQKCRAAIQQMCVNLGVSMNLKKTQIVKLSRGFTFLKVRFSITDSGKVVKRLNPKSVTGMRRKLKKFRRWVDEKKMTAFEAENSYQSWRGHVLYCNAYRTLRRMDDYYTSLFEGGVKFVPNYKKRHCCKRRR